jgi:hypothetical protein
MCCTAALLGMGVPREGCVTPVTALERSHTCRACAASECVCFLSTAVAVPSVCAQEEGVGRSNVRGLQDPHCMHTLVVGNAQPVSPRGRNQADASRLAGP